LKKKRAEFVKKVRRSSTVQEKKLGQASTRKRYKEHEKEGKRERERERTKENVRTREEIDKERRIGLGATQARLKKTVFDERRRFVFVAGLEGNGLILSLFLFPLHLVLKLTSCKVSAKRTHVYPFERVVVSERV